MGGREGGVCITFSHLCVMRVSGRKTPRSHSTISSLRLWPTPVRAQATCWAAMIRSTYTLCSSATSLRQVYFRQSQLDQRPRRRHCRARYLLFKVGEQDSQWQLRAPTSCSTGFPYPRRMPSCSCTALRVRGALRMTARPAGCVSLGNNTTWSSRVIDNWQSGIVGPCAVARVHTVRRLSRLVLLDQVGGKGNWLDATVYTALG